MGSQQAAQSRVHGLLKNLTSSSEHEACHLLEWLEAFSERLMKRADEVTAEVYKLAESTEVVEQELHNTSNSFRGLSSSQFVENFVYEEDETMFIHQETKVQEQGIPSQSYENDIVPRYKEAVASAWSIYEQHICKPHKRSSGPHKSRMLAERWHKHLPHIIGTEDFMRDNSCGLAEDRSTGLETFEFESDAEREAVDMTAELTNTGVFLETEQSGSDSDVSEDQVGSFEPAVSAALNFKAMLEAALRSSYIPYNDGILSNYNGSIEQLTPATAIAAISDEVPRDISKEGRTALQWNLKMEQLPTGHTQKSTMPEKHFKAVPSPPEDTAELQGSSNPTESHKVVSPKESGSEKEHVTKSIDTIINVLPSSATSGGLFDDEHEEDEFLGFQKIFRNINSWSSPTIPDGLFSDVPSPSSRNNSVTRSPGQPYMLMKKETEAQGKDLSHSSSTPQMNPSLHPEGLSSLKYTSYGHVHDLFSFQSSSSGSGALRESLSVFRKGLFDDGADDDNEDDTGDLFGPSCIMKDAQSLKETVGNDTFEDPKVKTSDGNMSPLTQETQKSARSMLVEDSRGDADEDFFTTPSQVEQVLMNDSISFDKDINDQVDISSGLEPVIVESKEEYFGRNDRWSSPDGVSGGNAITSLEHGSNSKNSLLLPSDKESDRALNSMTTVAKLYDSHRLGTEKDLRAGRESDDAVDSWSGASSIHDILPPENVVTNVVQSLPSLMRNGFHDEESQQWSEKDEGIGVHLLDQRKADELNTFSSPEENKLLIDASAGFPEGNTNETNLHEGEEVLDVPCVLEEVAKNVSSEWSRAKFLLQERLSLQPFGPSLRPGASASWSKAFVVDARAGENDDGLKDTAHLYHATMSRPRGSSRRRGPTSARKIPSCGSDADVTSVFPISSTKVEQTVAHSPEKQEQTGRVETMMGHPTSTKGSEMQAVVSVGRLISENHKRAQLNSFDYLSKRADAVTKESLPSRDVYRIGVHNLPNMSMAVTEISQIDDMVNVRCSEHKDVKWSANSPKQDMEESLIKTRPTTVNAEKASFNSLLFENDDDTDEVDLFGFVQGGTSTSFSNSTILSTDHSKPLFLYGNDEENSGIVSKVSLKGAHLKALTQPLQGTPDVGSMGPFRKSVGSSLFDEDDDEDSFT